MFQPTPQRPSDRANYVTDDQHAVARTLAYDMQRRLVSMRISKKIRVDHTLAQVSGTEDPDARALYLRPNADTTEISPNFVVIRADGAVALHSLSLADAIDHPAITGKTIFSWLNSASTEIGMMNAMTDIAVAHK